MTLSCRAFKWQMLPWLNTFPQGEPFLPQELGKLFEDFHKVLVSWDFSGFCSSFTLPSFMAPGGRCKVGERPLQSCSLPWVHSGPQTKRSPSTLRKQPHSNVRASLYPPSAALPHHRAPRTSHTSTTAQSLTNSWPCGRGYEEGC